MSRRSVILLATLVSLASCKGDDEPAPKAIDAAPAAKGTAAEESAPETKPDLPAPPRPGLHLDSVDTSYRPKRPSLRPRVAKEIELTLRSSPPGASASIDGRLIGVTPTFWRGDADDQPHEFTFVKEGYAMARYRFVATQSGVVHGTLQPLVQKKDDEAKAESDAGVE